MSGVLYIVATPIGNLEDITLRALRILREVDLILAEDTRVTRKLLSHYDIKKEVMSFHEHSRLTKMDYILRLLQEGKNLALVSDAGTPGISDPGQRLVNHLVVESLSRIEIQNSKIIPPPSYLGGEINYSSPYLREGVGGIKIVPIPGPNAAIAALSISGFPTDRFIFLGFPPHKKGREKFFKEVAETKETVVFYESPHRILKALAQLEKFVPSSREIVIARELTKMFETIYRGTIGNIAQKISDQEIKGEFVVVLGALYKNN